MGWENENVFPLVIITAGGGFTGLFVYSPGPGLGNLIASIAAQNGTDPFGNAFLAGVVSYTTFGGTNFAASLSNGAVQFWSAPGPGGPWALPAQIANEGITGGGLQIRSTFLGLVGGTSTGLVFAYPSGSASTDTTTLALLLNEGFTPVLAPGTWNLNCGNGILTSLGPGQYIIGCGDLNTIINAHGSGDLLRWVSTGAISDGTTTGGGFIGGATIDGSACSGVAVGIHAGDINALRFDVRCQKFNQTGGSWGFLFDNANNFTERMQLNIRAKANGFAGGDGGGVGFTVTPAAGPPVTSTASFARVSGRIEITTDTNQRDGLVLMNGAHIYDFDLELVGNWAGGASATTACAIRITGTVPALHPGAGTHSAISNGRLDVGCECSSGANTPTTIIQASTSNSITDTYGNMNWNTNFTSAGLSGAGFKYAGQVQGDTSLGTRLYYGTSTAQNITGNGQTISSIVPSAKIPVNCTFNATGTILSAGDVDGQLVYLINTGYQPFQFAAAVTSNVAGGVGVNVAAGAMHALIWDAGSALWYAT